jgi:hypothetical protein
VVNQPAIGQNKTEMDADILVRRLIAGVDTQDIVVYDVSDLQLFGRRHYRRLTGELAQAAEVSGCDLVPSTIVAGWDNSTSRIRKPWRHLGRYVPGRPDAKMGGTSRPLYWSPLVREKEMIKDKLDQFAAR